DAVTVHDPHGNITAWNRGAERMYGYTAAEALVMNAEQLVPAELRGKERALIERVTRGEPVDSWETQRIRKDGRTLDIWLTLTALRDARGQPIAVATTERDITERKRAQAELERNVAERTAAL